MMDQCINHKEFIPPILLSCFLQDRNEIPYNLNLAEAGFASFKNKNIVLSAPPILIVEPKPQSISITGVRWLNPPLRWHWFLIQIPIDLDLDMERT